MKVGIVSNDAAKINNVRIKSQINKNNFSVSQPLRTDKPLYPRGYQPYNISFGREISEHRSWGATINNDNTVNFKLFTFPDAKRVYVELIHPKKPEECADIEARPITISQDTLEAKPADRKSKLFELTNNGNGVFSAKNIPTDLTNTFYRYVIVKSADEVIKTKDPYTKEQPSILGWSKVHDPNNYKWTDQKWLSGEDSRRITRTATKKTQSINSLRIYEMNIPTITRTGDFEGAIKKLKEIKEKNLANAIEITPVENTYSKQWGYDGVDKFAVNEKLGGSKGLKKFVDTAHKLGLSVIIDIVPNHVGQDGNMLYKTGPYTNGSTKFGDRFNYEGQHNRYVRDFIANSAMHWAGEYHVDGLRLDMTNPSIMGSDYALKQIATEMNEHYPDVFLIAEDAENNRTKITTPLVSSGSHSTDLAAIDKSVHGIENHFFVDLDELKALGFDSEWDFPLMHSIVDMTENPNYMTLYRLDNTIKNSLHRVAYSISHDEIGNVDGTSSVTKYATRKMNLFCSIQGANDCEKGQRAAHATQTLLKLYATGKLDEMSDDEYNNALYQECYLTRYVPKEEIKQTYDYSLKKLKLALATAYSIPGPKMYFQGAENGNIAYFKFFRKFSNADSSNEQAKNEANTIISNMTVEKGYDAHFEPSYADSMQDSIAYSDEVRQKMNKVSAFTTKLNDIAAENPALQDGEIKGTLVFANELVHGVHCKSGDNETFAIKNYSDIAYDRFDIHFPEGNWVELANSDEEQFGGEGKYQNSSIIFKSAGESKSTIKLGDNSCAIFKRIS